jgi:hypothetical protein
MRGQPALVAAFVLALLPVKASAACAPTDASFAGHYYLHGVMEVGSELLLKPDGRFEYMLAYGALDELASGCWTRHGGVVTLNAHKFEASMEDPRLPSFIRGFDSLSTKLPNPLPVPSTKSQPGGLRRAWPDQSCRVEKPTQFTR